MDAVYTFSAYSPISMMYTFSVSSCAAKQLIHPVTTCHMGMSRMPMYFTLHMPYILSMNNGEYIMATLNVYEQDIQKVLKCDASWAQNVYTFMDIDLSEATVREFVSAVYRADMSAKEYSLGIDNEGL